MTSRFATAFSTEPANPQLDLTTGIGQRAETFHFSIVDAVTGYRTTVHPLDGPTPVLTHDTSRTIKRQIQGLNFGVEDTLAINSISARLDVEMEVAGELWPLGRYVYYDENELDFTSGTLSQGSFYDEGFIVDQPISQSFPVAPDADAAAISVQLLISQLLAPLPITYTAEPSAFRSAGSWTTGTMGGYVAEQLALDGDYFSPWFDNTNVMRFIRTFDPDTALPTFDLDVGNRVIRSNISRNNDLLNAPNRFIVIGNATGTNFAAPVVGVYDVPASAPHSIANRGFVISQPFNRQVEDSATARIVAQNIGLRQTLYERLYFSTALDPRHDGYDVLRWQGQNWLELAWTMPLKPGATMSHSARRVYTP